MNDLLAVDYQSARVLALGGSGHAAPWLNDAMYLNPSYASFNPIYSLNAGYQWLDTANGDGRVYSASIQDSRTELFQAGLGFTRREGAGVFNVGASRLAVQQLGIGMGMKYYIPDGRLNENFMDSIFSTTFLFSRVSSAALVIDHLLEPDEGKIFGNYRTFTLGLRYVAFDAVSLYIDPFWTPNYWGPKFGYSAGIEVQGLADLFFRAGRTCNNPIAYANDRGDGFGVGLGWIAPKLAIDYGFHRMTILDRGGPQINTHAASITVFF
jgi:hypothetical protein